MMQWFNESMNQWINESILLEAASYFGYFFSDCGLSCLPASSSVASATQFFSSCSCYIAFGNLQLQSRIAEASHASLMLCCAQPCQCDLSQPVANPHGRSVATNQPKFAQRQPCGLDHTNPELLRTRQFFALSGGNQALATVWKCKPSSCYSLIHISPTWSSKSAPNAFFLTFWRANRALARVPCAFCRQLCHITRKNTASQNKFVFTREFTRSRTVTLPNYLMMGGWHDDVVDMMVWMLTMTIVHKSEVF